MSAYSKRGRAIGALLVSVLLLNAFASAAATSSPTTAPATAMPATETPETQAPAAPTETAPASGGTIALLLPETKTTRYETADRPDFEAKFKELCPSCSVI